MNATIQRATAVALSPGFGLGYMIEMHETLCQHPEECIDVSMAAEDLLAQPSIFFQLRVDRYLVNRCRGDFIYDLAGYLVGLVGLGLMRHANYDTVVGFLTELSKNAGYTVELFGLESHVAVASSGNIEPLVLALMESTHRTDR